MTDVLILHRIPGAKPGDILPLTDRLKRHLEAGNAKLIPNGHEAWTAEPQEHPPVEPLRMESTGTIDDEADEDTVDEDEDEDAI